MEEKQKLPSHAGFGKVLTAPLFILTGLLLFARNMGIITEEWFNMLVAWHSLFIITGIYSMIRRHYLSGDILLPIGLYLLGSRFMPFPSNFQAILWPLVLIFIGISFFRHHHRTRHVVLDELFKGATYALTSAYHRPAPHEHSTRRNRTAVGEDTQCATFPTPPFIKGKGNKS